MKPPVTVKGCRSFAGMVNFLSIFCQDLQKLLKPIYDLTRKGRPFNWQQEQQTAFEEIKSRLQKPPILHLPDGKGRFHLYSDTSKYATGSALYQIQNGKPKLIAYASKRLPEAARNYSITELEMCGLAINITSFAHLLKKVDFDAIVDHLALVHILKSKTEPATPRIKRLLEVLSAYSFNLYYMKGKDMILSDFLSRQEIDKSNPHEIIPISFDMKAILNDKFYKVEEEESKYLVQTWSQTKDSGIKVPEVHGTKKGIDLNLRPEWLVRKSQKLVEKSRIEKNGTDLPRQRSQVIDQISTGQRKEIRKPKIEQGGENIPKQGYDPQESIIPIYPNQITKPIPKLTERVMQNDRQTDLELDLEINKDFEENSPYQEGIISEIYQRPNKSQIVDPPELIDLVNTERIVQKYLPKQTDIDKILKVIQRKVLKGTHLPITIKEIQAGYLNSPYFKDLYLYLSQNRMPSSKGAMCKIEILSERYILLDSLLFKLNIEKEKAVMAIPEVCVDQIITLYHSSLFAGHQGVIKTYLTISDKFFIPDLMHYLRSYIKGCHICQLSNKDKIPNRHFQRRINLNYKPLSKLSMDLKVMPKSYRGHKFILCVIDEMTNYLITMPIYQARSEEIGDSLIDNVISKYGIPEYLIMDQDSAFMSTIMNHLFRRLNIKIKTVAPFNHKSLQAEHGIKSLSTILTKHLTEQGQMWPKYLPLATLAHNTFNFPNLANYSPYKLTFGRKPKILIDIETDPDIKVSGNFTEYYKLLEK